MRYLYAQNFTEPRGHEADAYEVDGLAPAHDTVLLHCVALKERPTDAETLAEAGMAATAVIASATPVAPTLLSRPFGKSNMPNLSRVHLLMGRR